jgi:mono/diheme cytochrome c family protein
MVRGPKTMRAFANAAAAAIVGAVAIVCVALPQAIQQNPPSKPDARAAEGQKVFQVTCSTQYCHGPGGSGGQGPRLIDHPMSPEYVRATIRDGRPGTNMAPFKSVLDAGEIDAVVAYVLSLSPPAAPGASKPLESSKPSEPSKEPSSLPVSVGREKGIPAAGAEVFFDATHLSSCRACHSYDKRGGPLGVDFANATMTPEAVLASITKPRVASRNYPVVAVTLGGERLTGIRGAETADTLQVFDVVVPPVRRDFQKSQITVVAVEGKGIFDHTKLGLTHQQLLDMAALLSSGNAASTP